MIRSHKYHIAVCMNWSMFLSAFVQHTEYGYIVNLMVSSRDCDLIVVISHDLKSTKLCTNKGRECTQWFYIINGDWRPHHVFISIICIYKRTFHSIFKYCFSPILSNVLSSQHLICSHFPVLHILVYPSFLLFVSSEEMLHIKETLDSKNSS